MYVIDPASLHHIRSTIHYRIVYRDPRIQRYNDTVSIRIIYTHDTHDDTPLGYGETYTVLIQV